MSASDAARDTNSHAAALGSTPAHTISEIFSSQDLLGRVASFLPRQEVICNLRLVSKLCTKLNPASLVLHLSQPVPQHTFLHRWGRPGATEDLTCYQRRKFICLTARSGSLANLEVAFAAAQCELQRPYWRFMLMSAAAAGGNLGMCEWLLARGFQPQPDALIAAAERGHREIVRWLSELRRSAMPNDKLMQRIDLEDCFIAAAGSGHRVVCETLLLERRLRWVPLGALYEAARGGHVGLTDWLLDLRTRPNESGLYLEQCSVLLTQAWYGFGLYDAQRLHTTRLPALVRRDEGDPHSAEDPWRKDVVSFMKAAVSSPTADWQAKLQWLEGLYGGPCPLVDLDDLRRHLFHLRPDADVRLQALQARGPLALMPAFGGLVEGVAAAGNVAALRLLLAAAEGQGEVPQLRLSDIQKAMTIDSAVLHGHVEVLTELLARPGWPEWKFLEASARHGQLHVLQRMAAAPEVVATDTAAAPGAIGSEAARPVGHNMTLRRALQDQQLALIKAAASSGSLPLMVWLREEQHCAWNETVFLHAVQSGNVLLLRYLAEHGCPIPADQPYLAAATEADWSTVLCLRELGCAWSKVFPAVLCDANVSLEFLRRLVDLGCPMDWRAAWKAARDLRIGADVKNWIRDHLDAEDVDDT